MERVDETPLYTYVWKYAKHLGPATVTTIQLDLCDLLTECLTRTLSNREESKPGAPHNKLCIRRG